MAPKPMRRAVGACALLLTGALAVTGCSSSTQGGGGAAPEKTGTLVIDQAFTAQSIDPATIFQVTDAITASGLYQTLFTYIDNVADPQPLLAESITANDAATEFTITLRDDATFANGNPVTAADVVFSLNRLKHLAASPAYRMEGITVAEVDERTVQLTTENPAPYIEHTLTAPPLAIVDDEAVRAAGGTDAEDAADADTAGQFFTQPANGAGSGPYALESYDTNAQIVLVKNENYWGEAPAYDRIVIRNVNNAQQQKANIEGGDSQIALDIPGRIAEGMESEALQVQSSSSPEVLYLALSQKEGAATADPDIVEAIKTGIDYEALRTLVGAGAKEATGIIPSMMIGALPEGEGPESDPEAAKQLLADAGKTGTEVTLDYANDYTRLAGIDYNTLAQGLQTQLEAIGLKVTLNPTPTSTSLQRYVDGETEMALWSWPPDTADASDELVFAPGGLIGERVHWPAEAAPETAELAEAARVATGDDREAAFTAWNESMNEEAPFAFLLEPSFFLVASTSVEHVSHDPLAAINLSQID
ncbi:ABC transporter substrate-binding protein [Leucobacter chromiiresistens]|uniref:Peptide/nickel transport system substrate-binding protein n=1 Tax=Leucobacter chromiiresistens TaxID=1079994 RepID=A0A1H0YNY4_9MICO|nr:ABC transporter substrate-binding protein [Leucobacter chromiiresistens]SDQ16855.1 peptide/nickel transport system substrate-binding protein [Leucobacter chromiiresistens]